MKERLYQVIEAAGTGDRLSRFYDWLMMGTIFVSILPLTTKSTAPWTVAVDKVTVAVFILDYLLRLYTATYKLPGHGWKSYFIYPITPMALLDLVTILPSFGVVSKGFRIFRLFRIVRTFKVFRVLKFARYSRSIDIILSVLKQQWEALAAVGGLAIAYILISALIVFNVEPDTFGNFYEAIYWAAVSLTTVGYGDIYPVTQAGRLVTMLSSAAGIAIVALPAGIITAGYMDAINKQED